MTSQVRSHKRIFGSTLVHPALDGCIVEYDFTATPTLVAGQVKDAIATVVGGDGIAADAIEVQADHADGHPVLIARIGLTKAQYDVITGRISRDGWVKAHFLDKGLIVIGLRVTTRIMVSFALNDKRHHFAQPQGARQEFDRGGRHYVLSEDGSTWLDGGAASPCCHC